MTLKTWKQGCVVGTLSLTKLKTGEIEIEYLWVHPNFRGNGIASRMKKRAMDVARKQGRSIVSFINPDHSGMNEEQLKEWNKRLGFKPCRFEFDAGFPKKAMIWHPNGINGKDER